MPPRFAYWTIIAGGLPTAFRAAEREDLQPTFQRIKEKHPDAEMKWFARGKLWDSKEDAERERDAWKARVADRERGGGRDRRPPDSSGPSGPPRVDKPRGRDWRPGGEHKDPRQKYKDAKKARNLDRRQERFARKHGETTPRVEKPGGDTPRTERPLPTGPRSDQPRTDRPRFDGKPRFDKPRFDPSTRSGSPRGNSRDDKPRPDGPRAARPEGDRPPRRFDRPEKNFDRPEKKWDRPAEKKWDRPGPKFGRPPGKPFGSRPAGGPKPTGPSGGSKPAQPGGHRPSGPKPGGARSGGPRPEGPAGWKKGPPGAARDRDRKGPPRDKRRK
jgi:hypothetical protein